MHDYLFVWERASGKFLEHCEVEEKTNEEKEKMITELRARFPEPEYDVAVMAATDWNTVEENYPGINNEY